MELYSYNMIGEEFLEHYGVKGMKWGVRRAKKNLQGVARGVRKVKSAYRARQERRHPKSADSIKVADLRKQVKKKGIESLTNAELSQLNNRLILENTYRKAMTHHPDTIRAQRNKKIALEGAKLIAPIAGKAVGNELKKSDDPRVKIGGAFLTGDINISDFTGGGNKGKKKRK